MTNNPDKFAAQEQIIDWMKSRQRSARRISVARPSEGLGPCQFYGALSQKIIEDISSINSLTKRVISIVCNPKWIADQNREHFEKNNADILSFEPPRARNIRLDSYGHEAEILSAHILRSMTLNTAAHFERSFRRLLLSQFDIQDSLLCKALHGKFPKRKDVIKGNFQDLVSIVENYFYVPIKTLPGFNQVEELLTVSNVIKHGDGVSLELLTKKASIRVIKDSELFEPEHRILMSKELLVQDVSATDKLLHNIMECSITLNAQFEEFLMKELAPLNEAGKDVEGKALIQEKWPIPIDVKKSLHKKRGPTRPSSSLNAS